MMDILIFRIEDATRIVRQLCNAAAAHAHRIGYDLHGPLSASLIHCCHLKHLNFYKSSYVILFHDSSTIIGTRVSSICSNTCRSVLLSMPVGSAWFWGTCKGACIPETLKVEWRRDLEMGHLSPREFHEGNLEGGLHYWAPRRLSKALETGVCFHGSGEPARVLVNRRL